MNIQLDYNEIYEIAKEHFDKEVEVEFAGPKTCKVSAGIEMPIVRKVISVSLNVDIDEVRDNTVYLTVSGNPLIDMLLPAGIAMIENSVGDMVETESGGKVIVNLNKCSKLEQVLKYATLSDINFDEDSAHFIVNKV